MHQFFLLIQRRFCLISVALTFFLAARSDAGARDTVTIAYLDTPPTIDGDPGEWLSREPVSFRDDNVADNLQNSVHVYLGWDEQQLYFCCRVYDAHLCTDKHIDDTLNIHLNDAIEIWLDSHNDSKTILDENDFHFIVDILNRSILFRGDKTLIEMGEQTGLVPQRAGNTPIVYSYATQYHGTLNTLTDHDSGYVVELAVPWSAIGVQPHQEYPFKLDVCMNDQDMPYAAKPANMNDSLAEQCYLARFHFVNWAGSRDFGFPNTWRSVRLVGTPAFLTSLSRHYSTYWLSAFLFTVIASFLTIGFMSYRIYKLKNLPTRRKIKINPVVSEPHAHLSSQQKVILNARAYIESNISGIITSESLANQLAISIRQLQRIIKEELQTTPTKLIHIVRLEKAASLLLSKERNVTEIAFAVGFNDSSHFSKLFKKYYGVSPSQYSDKMPLFSKNEDVTTDA